MNDNSLSKDELRGSLPCSDLSAAQFGRLAEQVRRLSYYGEARQIFVDPVPSLLQVRINAILDRKELILPSGGLKEGFFLVKPHTIPFNKLSYALSFKGISEFGEKLPSAILGRLEIGIAVVASEAVDIFGGHLGDGLGFTDISLALLKEYGALANNCKIIAGAAANRVLTEPLPSDPWDINLDGYVTQTGTQSVSSAGSIPNIIWSALPKKRVRKIQPLWDLYCTNNPIMG
jgi:5-formyltetrahydrofolate cyclo-ligase